MVMLTPEDFRLMKDAGLVTFADNPWANPDSELYKIAKKNGYKVRYGKVLKKTAKWAKARMHYDGMSSRQLLVLKTAVEAIKNAPRDDKGKMTVHPTEVIAKAFQNWEYAERQPRRANIDRTLRKINQALAKAREREAEEAREREAEEAEVEATTRRRPLAVA
jgi:hypothetical protein